MKCKYCDKEIKGYIETSKLDPKIKLCRNCYYTEMMAIAMSKSAEPCCQPNEPAERRGRDTARCCG